MLKWGAKPCQDAGADLLLQEQCGVRFLPAVPSRKGHDGHVSLLFIDLIVNLSLGILMPFSGWHSLMEATKMVRRKVDLFIQEERR